MAPSALPPRTIWLGNPVVAGHQPDPTEIVRWAEIKDALISSGSLGSNWKATKALLDADLDHDAEMIAVVYDDSTPANNGTYVKVGASGAGSWTQLTNFLPGYQVVSVSDDENSTANAMTMNATPYVPVEDGAALIVGSVPVTNTSATVTISFDGGATTYAVKTASENNPAVGTLVAGMPFIGQISESGTVFRIVSDIASAAIQAACEAALEATEDARDVALAASGRYVYKTRADLVAALVHVDWEAPPVGTVFFVNDLQYRWVGGSTAVPDLSGFVPAGRPSLEHFNILPDVSAEGFNAADLGLTGAMLTIPDGNYIFTGEVNLSALAGIDIEGNPTFDFGTATNAALFPNQGHITIYGGDLIALDDLSVDAVEGESTLTFATDQGLETTDIIGIYNPTDYSYLSSRTYYRAGEWCRVAVNDAVCELFGSLRESYALADVDIYKHPKKTFAMSGGKITIKESHAAGFSGIAGFHAKRIVDADFSHIRPTRSLYGAMLLTQCLGIHGNGYLVNQADYSGGSGVYYGVVWANCQDCSIEGLLYGGRHATTTGGSSEAMAVPCRNITVRGTAVNAHDASGGVGAVNTHGNTQDFTFEGIADGGFSGGGNNIKFRGKLIAKAAQNGIAVLLSELRGCDFDFQGVEIVSYGNSNVLQRGVIDVGGNATGALDTNCIKGGTFNFSNAKMTARDGTRAIMIRNRGYVGAEKVNINLKGFELHEDAGVTPVILFTSVVSGNNFNRLMLDGLLNGPDALWSVAGIDKISGWRQSGVATVTPASTAVALAETLVTINAPKTPNFLVTQGQHLVGNKKCVASYRTPAPTSFRARVDTADSTNFTSTTAGIVSWLATIDD